MDVIQNGEEVDEPVENDKKDESDEETKGDDVKPLEEIKEKKEKKPMTAKALINLHTTARKGHGLN